MRAVDTNLLVRLITRDDPAQVKAAEAFVGGGAWVSQLVLAETVWVLDAVHGRSAGQLAAAIEMLLNHRQLAVQDSDVVLRALEQFRARPALGFSDCLVLEVARRAGHLPLGTFDRQLSRLEGAQRL
ncbi:MAG: type II toxin-antitoxin system VapC family toxin [Steroidobacteraceae bacterium]